MKPFKTFLICVLSIQWRNSAVGVAIDSSPRRGHESDLAVGKFIFPANAFACRMAAAVMSLLLTD